MQNGEIPDANLKKPEKQMKIQRIIDKALTSVGVGRKIARLSYLTAFAIQQIIYNRIIEVSRGAQTIKENR